MGVSFHHPINPLIPEEAFRMEIELQKYIMREVWGEEFSSPKGFFPAELCFSERMIPVLVEEGFQWVLVPNTHISRACINYPYEPYNDSIDPPNLADQLNEASNSWISIRISRGVKPTNAVPLAYKPHYAQYVNPNTGDISKIVVVPVAMAMSWNEGAGGYGLNEIEQIMYAGSDNDPLLVVFAHDGDNFYSGGYSYYNQNVPSFCHNAQNNYIHPTQIDEFLSHFPPKPNDVVHVEDGGWVNADGDFGHPMFINWNWPLVNQFGEFDIVKGWAEDERNWAVIVACNNRVLTAQDVSGEEVRIAKIVEPGSEANAIERAWHFYLASLESGYMYYGKAIDMEVKPTLAVNEAFYYTDLILQGSFPDRVPPTVWIPQRLPYNPGGKGMGPLWNYEYQDMCKDFFVWTFVYDVSGVSEVHLKYRFDNDNYNNPNSIDNETYSGGSEVGDWVSIKMKKRVFPKDNYFNDPEIDFFELPKYIADEYWCKLKGLSNVLIDYYVEAVDNYGNINRSPIQHVYVGNNDCPEKRVSWEPEYPNKNDVIRINVKDASTGAYLHWGVNAEGHQWQQPYEEYWPEGSYLFNGTGPAVETPFIGPDENGNLYIDIGPFNLPAQEVKTIDFVIHFIDGNWDNNNGKDYHIFLNEESSQETPTPPIFPTITTIPTLPTSTPNKEIYLNLILNNQEFQAGDLFKLDVEILNNLQINVKVNFFLVLEAFGVYYFYPFWKQYISSVLINLSVGYFKENILNFYLPEDLPMGTPFYFHSILIDPNKNIPLSNYDYVEFKFY